MKLKINLEQLIGEMKALFEFTGLPHLLNIAGYLYRNKMKIIVVCSSYRLEPHTLVIQVREA